MSLSEGSTVIKSQTQLVTEAALTNVLHDLNVVSEDSKNFLPAQDALGYASSETNRNVEKDLKNVLENQDENKGLIETVQTTIGTVDDGRSLLERQSSFENDVKVMLDHHHKDLMFLTNLVHHFFISIYSYIAPPPDPLPANLAGDPEWMKKVATRAAEEIAEKVTSTMADCKLLTTSDNDEHHHHHHGGHHHSDD
ncbi:hypothetical protein AGMMS49949_04850 [Alphaproteobacteria bacterium]|nr:hypothetical protein AGMMS49949_04850 [Alphaproteobacteria bacterium]GHS97201.1 hypothetical protein AGMMS50296_3980 [Alphaproteobacteria bacterium]